MAKYCVKCGKTLPDGVEVCSECAAADSARTTAAPFTRLTSETEVWKDNSQNAKKRRTPIKERFSTNKLVAMTSIIVVVILGALTFVMTRPAVRVSNALNSGDFDKAVTIYSENFSGGQVPSMIRKTLQQTARGAYSDLMEASITAEEGEEVFAGLFAFSKTDAIVNEVYAQFQSLARSRAVASDAALSESNGEYLAASDSYRLVIEADSRYAEAQEASVRCLESYAAQMVSAAQACVDEKDFDGAIALLEEGDSELKARETFSADIDKLLLNCFAQYEQYIITESKSLAELEEYENAAALIEGYFTAYGRESEKLTEALKEYVHLAQKKVISTAVAKSDEFYEQGSYTEAFAELDLAAENSEAAEAMAVPIAELEQRFAYDMLTEASTVFDGKVENAEEASGIIADALEIREIAKLEAYYEYLENLIPLDLNATTNCEKQGVIYRNVTDFECVDGTDYTDGWMWGEDESSVTYKLGGEYSVFRAVFAVRRAEGAEKQANFEIWFDGELAYTSDILYATESKMPIELDVTGVEEMQIIFYANYETSGTEGGYCCHGLCSPRVEKTPEAFIYEDE